MFRNVMKNEMCLFGLCVMKLSYKSWRSELFKLIDYIAKSEKIKLIIEVIDTNT